MTSEEEKKITEQRTSGWFAEFVTRTDEKTVTSDALAKFFMHLRTTNLAPQIFHQEPVILDIGTGTGHLSSRIKQLLEEMSAEGPAGGAISNRRYE